MSELPPCSGELSESLHSNTDDQTDVKGSKRINLQCNGETSASKDKVQLSKSQSSLEHLFLSARLEPEEDHKVRVLGKVLCVSLPTPPQNMIQYMILIACFPLHDVIICSCCMQFCEQSCFHDCLCYRIILLVIYLQVVYVNHANDKKVNRERSEGSELKQIDYVDKAPYLPSVRFNQKFNCKYNHACKSHS